MLMNPIQHGAEMHHPRAGSTQREVPDLREAAKGQVVDNQLLYQMDGYLQLQKPLLLSSAMLCESS
jgi:hypothetical protein